MSIHLNERQVGFDTHTVGFPDIGSCMGLAIQVDGGLYGFHIMPRENDKVGAFLTYFQNHLSTGVMNHLYGCCRWTQRYAAAGVRQDWVDEMTAIAALLGYRGPVSGFDAAQHTKIAATEAIYIELRRTGTHSVSYHHKRSSKMDYTKAYTPSTSPDLRGVLPSNGGFITSTQLAFGNTSAATVQATRSNKGELHEVKAKYVETFHIP